MYRPRTAFESADTVNRVVALLVRFPELHGLRSNPVDATLSLTYAVGKRLDPAAARVFADVLDEHVRAFHDLQGEPLERIGVVCERGADVTFVQVTRDLATFSPDELALQVAVLSNHFGAALLRNPEPDGPVDEEGAATTEESVELALDVLRDPAQRQRLVGVREEKRVLVYFVHPGKRTKVRARS